MKKIDERIKQKIKEFKKEHQYEYLSGSALVSVAEGASSEEEALQRLYKYKDDFLYDLDENNMTSHDTKFENLDLEQELLKIRNNFVESALLIVLRQKRDFNWEIAESTVVSHGVRDACLGVYDKARMMEKILKYVDYNEVNPIGVILVHNHPTSVIARPSPGDLVNTLSLQTALRMVGIELLDEIIISKFDTYSFAQNSKEEGNDYLLLKNFVKFSKEEIKTLDEIDPNIKTLIKAMHY